ncbi:enhanced serine sensitivity protein SseB [Streptomyces inusitatus]|uniref:Enhanced serine sensitivity protein SseB n=1 Tax=Streptomyces inusitatus TaxID=68221 RepID=A0A918QGM6_9ACTN|nr:enhanced serine sensitivity protein SseB [Streptomyces inusitatus]GGZ48616.1 enhanced serine sensitivity protein SseB [Streptomyces inusitatus]
MTIPEHPHPYPQPYGGGWPANELEETLTASLGDPLAGARLVEVIGRSPIWVPLPRGGSPESRDLDLPTMEIDGIPYVPVFSSEQQFMSCVGPHMSFTVAPARDFARGLPPQLGIAVNPGGTVGAPLPPPAVAELCRAGAPAPAAGPAPGGRVRMFEPDWQEEPIDFLSAAAGEFQQAGNVLTARRALASVEGDPPALFIGVQLASWEGPGGSAPLDALGRALGRVQVGWPVNLVLLDVAQDPVADWMLAQVRPFYQRDHHESPRPGTL